MLENVNVIGLVASALKKPSLTIISAKANSGKSKLLCEAFAEVRKYCKDIVLWNEDSVFINSNHKIVLIDDVSEERLDSLVEMAKDYSCHFIVTTVSEKDSNNPIKLIYA